MSLDEKTIRNPACCDYDPDTNNIDEIESVYELAELFKVFGDTTRLRILSCLLDGEHCVHEIAARVEMGQSAVSHQLRVLRGARLVRVRRSGKSAYYSLDDAHVKLIIEIGFEHLNHKEGEA